MERVSLIRQRVLPLMLLVFGCSLGCASSDKMQQSFTSMKRTLHLEAAEPATQVLCFWQRRLNALPDPVHDGTQVAGITGQVFFLSGTEKHAEAGGDLAIMAYDETPRAPGQQAQKDEMWHITKETLAKLRTKDERLGPCYALFLPWPPEWKDVTTIKLKARYQAPGQPDLHSAEVKMAIDYSAPGTPTWSDQASANAGMGPTGTMAGRVDTRSVPDPSRILQEVRTANATVPQGSPSNAIVPASNWPQQPTTNVVPVTNLQPNPGTVNTPSQSPSGWPGTPATTATNPGSPATGGFQPIIINRTR